MGIVSLPQSSSVNPNMNEEKITASGTWTAPTGVNKVWLHMIGGGGGGAQNNANGLKNGGAAGQIVYQQVTVSAGTAYTTTIGAGGTGGTTGTAGSATSIFSLSAAGGGGGAINFGSMGYPGALSQGVSGGLQGAVPAVGAAGPANSGIPGAARYNATAGNNGGSGLIILKWLS